MGESNLYTHREFLFRLIDETATAGFRPYVKDLQFIKNFSECPAEW
jgi:hypothetical protein